MRTKVVACITAFALLLTGCTSIGPKIAREVQYPYNEAVIGSWKEQLLLNLVRLRYRDNPYFLELSSITSAHALDFNLKTTFKMPGPINPADNSIAPSISLKDSPTLTYLPLQGEAFVKRLLSPIELEQIIGLINSGWGIDRVLDICVQEINQIENAPSASGPTPEIAPVFEKFDGLARNLRTLQIANGLEVGSDPRHDPTKLEVILDPGKTQYLHFERNPKYSSVLNEVYNTLDLSLEYTDIAITTNFLKENVPNRIKIKPRTLLGSLFYLSQAIDIPEEHIEEGLVTMTCCADGSYFNWEALSGRNMVIRSSRANPRNAAVKVCYRDYWYYIEDSDLNSKSSFLLLSMLFNLKAASSGASIPQITIPALR